MKSSKPWLYAVARAFDRAAGGALRRVRRPMPDRPRRILVSNIGHLGDALLTLGVPGALRREIPDAEIDVLVSSDGARLFAGHADVSSVFVHDALLLHRVRRSAVASDSWNLREWSTARHVNGEDRRDVNAGGQANGGNGNGTVDGRSLSARLRDREYDIAIELRSYVPNSIPLLVRSGTRYLSGFGSAGFSFMLDRVVPHIDGEHELKRFGRAIRAVTGHDTAAPPVPDLRHFFADGSNANGSRSPYTVLHPGTRRRRKRWRADRWRTLAASLADRGASVVITGATSERDWLEATFDSVPADIVTGSLDVPGLARLYGQSAAFIGVDSFPAHLAAAAGAPHVVVLWHEYADPAEWAPVGDGRVSVLPSGSTSETVLRTIAESA